MRRRLAIVGLLLSLVLLVVAMSAMGQEPAAEQWPPPEVTVQPRPDPDHGPMPVDPVPPSAPAASPADGGWWWVDHLFEVGISVLATLGACHLKLRFAPGGGIDVSGGKGSADPDLLAAIREHQEQMGRLDHKLEVALPLLEAIQSSPPTPPAPAGSPSLQLPSVSTNPDPAPLQLPRPVGGVEPL